MYCTMKSHVYKVPGLHMSEFLMIHCAVGTVQLIGCCYITVDPVTSFSEKGICFTQQMCRKMIFFHNGSTTKD
jgi:hypothetical protein